MGQHTTGKLRGIGVAMERWHPDYLDDELVQLSQASPLPGTARTDAARPRLVPQLTGAQSQTIELVVVESGIPRQGGAGLQVGWRLEDEGTPRIRGLRKPTVIEDARLWGSRTTTALEDTHVCAALFPASGKVAVYSGGSTSTSGLNSLAVWDPHTDAFEADQVLEDSTYTRPAFAVVPGTEHLLMICESRVDLSTNYGVDWTQVSGSGYADASSGSPTYANSNGRVRAAFDGVGNLLVVAQDTSAGPTTDFYVSSDEGASFAEVERVDPTGVVQLVWDVCSHPSGAIFFAYYDSNSAGIFVKRLGSAHEVPSTLTAVEVGSGLTAQALQIASEDNGTLWVFRTTTGASNVMVAYYSTDEGDTWTAETNGSPYVDQDGGGDPDHWLAAALVPCAYGGLCGPVILGEATAPFSIPSGSRTAFVRLGGWTAPDRYQGNQWGATTSAHWFSAVGINPSNVGWTETTAGTVTREYVTGGTAAAAAPYGYWRMYSTAVAGLVRYDYTLSASDQTEAAAEFLVRIEDDLGAATAIAEGIYVRLLTQSAAANKQTTLQLRMDAEGFRVWDAEAGAWLGDKVLIDLTVPTAFRFTKTTAGPAETQYQTRDPDAATVERTQWTKHQWSAPTESATGSSGAAIRWGNVTNAANWQVAWWYVRGRCNNAVAVQGLSVTGTGGAGYPVFIPGGHDGDTERACFLTLGGHGITGDEYVVEPKYGYPINAVFPAVEPSPDVVWRSTDRDTDVRLACSTLDDSTGYFGTIPEGESTLTCVIRNANCRKIALIQWEPTEIGFPANYTTLATMDLATGFTAENQGLAYSRIESAGDNRHNWLKPSGAGVGARRLRAGELRGGFVVLDPAGVHATLPGPHYVRIADNTAGWWDTSKGLRARILLADGLDNDLHPETGGISIVWPSGVYVVAKDPAAVAEARVAPARLGVAFLAGSDGGSPDDFWEVGTIALCPVIFPGKQYGHGRVIAHAPNVAEDVDDYGTARRSRRGPMGRTWEVTWDHGVKGDRVRSGDEWLTPIASAASTAAVAGRDDVSGQLLDVFRTARDGERPVLLLATDLEELTSSGGVVASGMITDATLWLFGHLVSDLRVVQARGDEGEDEYELAGPLAVRELV